MTYQITAYDEDGRRIADLGLRGCMAGARQAMLDHAGAIDLPPDEPLFLPALGIMEDWFFYRCHTGRPTVEYCISYVETRA